MNLIKRQYDRSYFETIGFKEKPNSKRNKSRLYEILNHKTEGKLLEIGCGEGGFLELAAKYFNIEGIDISDYAVNLIQHNFSHKIRIADIEQELLPANHYNVIAVFNVLEHLIKPGEVITNIFQSLSDEGIVIGSVPHKYGIIGNLNTSFTNFLDRTHISTYPPNRWRTLFEDAGFKKIDFFGEITVGRNFNIYLRNGVWKHLSFNLMFLCIK